VGGPWYQWSTIQLPYSFDSEPFPPKTYPNSRSWVDIKITVNFLDFFKWHISIESPPNTAFFPRYILWHIFTLIYFLVLPWALSNLMAIRLAHLSATFLALPYLVIPSNPRRPSQRNHPPSQQSQKKKMPKTGSY